MSQSDGKIKKKFTEILPGQIFGKLTVIKNVGYPSYVVSKINYYLCQCTCGKQKEIRRNHLLSGKSTTCGCGVRERNLKERGTISYTCLFNVCKQGALSRKLEFSLTKEEHKNIITKSCHYCGAEPKYWNVGKTKEGLIRSYRTPIDIERAAVYVNGVDRVDSKQGYTIENTVPCCFPCNTAKWESSRDDFIKHCRKIVAFQDAKKGK
jgi:hypothetical protein